LAEKENSLKLEKKFSDKKSNLTQKLDFKIEECLNFQNQCLSLKIELSEAIKQYENDIEVNSELNS
jgi:hypothetical protein